MMGKRIIITGQSGIRIKESIDSFVRNASAFTQGQEPPLPFKLEAKMTEIYCEQEGKDEYENIWMDEILKLPVAELQCLWELAFKQILDKIGSPELEQKDILLNFHASFYHQETVEHLTVVKEECIKKFNPDLFITFIDDIYDVHKRLKSPGQMFCSSYGGANEPVGCICELSRILDWRAIEIMMTRHLADTFGRDHYVFAVKHSCDTLYKLICRKSPTFYISHPITEVRRLEGADRKQEAERIIDEIHRFENKMSESFVCFLPTTIDELRIKDNGDHVSRCLQRELLPRWDANKYDHPVGLLYIVPNNIGDPLWIGTEGDVSDDLNLLLQELERNIDVQISSRDHKLVEQSNFLAVYRPCFNGNASRGVMEEVNHYSRLKRDVEKNGCFIYAPIKDQNLFRIKQFERAINNEIRKDKGRIKYPPETFKLSEEEKELLIQTVEGDKIKTLARKIIDEHSGMTIISNKRRGVAPGAAQEATKFIDDLVKEYISICQAKFAQYKNAATELWEDDGLTPEAFVGKIIQHFKGVS